ncbi:MAG TPA: hypothetical protein VG167_06870 [Verrucomicrobiae bacterium]|nr:hypothetical protein [Verrucomicrobiae bacterium]
MQISSKFWQVAARACGCVSVAIILAACAHERAIAPPDYASRYHYPLLSAGTQFGGLPPAVQRTVRSETGGAPIADVQKTTRADGSLVYVITFEKASVMPPLYIAPDGTVLTPDMRVLIPAPAETVAGLTGGPVTGLTLSDLPVKVVKTIQEKAPDAEVDYIKREGEGEHLVYAITFKDQKRPTLYVAPDGAVVSHEQK